MGRETEFFVATGANRTGKTSIARAFIIDYINANPGNNIITFDPQYKFTDLADMTIDLSAANDRKDSWAVSVSKVKNSLLILDDYRMLCGGNQVGEGWFSLLGLRAENSIDILIICHHPSQVQRIFSSFITGVLVFYTKNVVNNSKWFDRFDQHQEMVAEYKHYQMLIAKMGSLKLNRKLIRECFPYSVIDRDGKVERRNDPDSFNGHESETVEGEENADYYENSAERPDFSENEEDDFQDEEEE
jgi:hypothetical protein